MIDQQKLYQKQISDFLTEHKNRFTAVNNQGKSGYSTKLNRQPDGITLFIYFTDKFPQEPPLVYVSPKIDHEIVDQNGRIKDDSVIVWNYQSSLKNSVSIILNKLESQGNVNSNNIMRANVRTNVSASDNELSNEIRKDLESKSIEELIYINFNQEEYISEFTKKYTLNISELLAECKSNAERLEKIKAQYEDFKATLARFQPTYEEKVNQLKVLNQEKMTIDNKFTIESLQNEIRKYIDDEVKKPKDQLINDFLSKRIDFNMFIDSFKNACAKYHYYMIVNEKLSALKN